MLISLASPLAIGPQQQLFDYLSEPYYAHITTRIIGHLVFENGYVIKEDLSMAML
jgi:hypothetical protein